MPQSSK